jgi:ATP-dependent DNA helicase PIF1
MNETDENTRQEKRLMGEMMVAQLNDRQRAAFEQIMASINDVDNILPRQYFLDGPGGTGKTFLYNTIITVLQGQGKNVIAVASTGIASTLLIDGATYHSQFKLYSPITETTRSKIEDGSFSAQLIRKADLTNAKQPLFITNQDAPKHISMTSAVLLEPHSLAVKCVHICGPCAFTASEDGTINAYDLKTNSLLQKLDFKHVATWMFGIAMRTSNEILG